MALPKYTAPTYDCTLPVSKLKVAFKPFLAKEEKILLIAQESKNPKDILRAMKEVVSNCTMGKVDASTLSSVDLEYLFLNLRMKSVGETIELKYSCTGKDKEGKECDQQLPVSINFEKVEVTNLDKYKEKQKIMLTDKVGIVFKIPSSDDAMAVSEDGENTAEQLFSLIRSSVDYVFDGEQIYKEGDFTKEEIDAFIEGMSVDAFRKIQDFFEVIPKLSYKTEVKCPKCNHVNKIELQGLQDFFQ